MLRASAGVTFGVMVLALGCSTPEKSPASAMDVADAAALPEDAPVGSPDDVPVEEPDAGGDVDEPIADIHPDVGPITAPFALAVIVRVDGVPTEGVRVMQGGTIDRFSTTDADGMTTVTIDPAIPGDWMVVATHPETRNGGTILYPSAISEPTEVDLKRFDTSDNPDYEFLAPGKPGESNSTAFCGHCHLSADADWWESAHRSSAKNPVVHDMYAGTAAAFATEATCVKGGGTWRMGITPGTGKPGWRCYVGPGALQDLNPGCDAGGESCDGKAADTGGCAGCHAPGIDGELVGRDLLDATDWAYEGGVHCDVCHRVESVDAESPLPGFGGRLNALRPTEAPLSPVLGDWLPLTFGPSHDSVNVKMGSVQRDHFHQAAMCAGCHELDVGELPVQSTYSEWKAGPFAEVTPCQSCHMPPDPMVTNAADSQAFPTAPLGVVAGWLRPPGAVNRHQFLGPRTPDGGMLESAAALFVETGVADGVLTATVRTRNTGPGHAIPTGEPMRHLVLEVTATCDGEALLAVGGDTVPAFAGYADRKEAGDDWSEWPGAQVGDVIRVVTRTGGYHDYTGPGAFGAAMPAADKGLPVEEWLGQAVVTAIDGAAVTLDAPLPPGGVAYRVTDPVYQAAGRPGFAFGRVLVDGAGAPLVFHTAATAIRSDNRLPPQTEYATQHRFAATCEAPRVEARLLYRPYAPNLALTKGWALQEQVMDRVVAGVEAPPVVEPTPPVATGSTVDLTLTAAPHTHLIGGVPAEGYAYNGQLPGPTIRARIGDTLRVQLINELEEPTTIHWHGLELPNEMDGVPWMKAPVQPGESFTYEFVLSQSGTFWYHPHFNTAQQVDRGLYGVLVVEDPAEPAVDQDLALVLDGWSEFQGALGDDHHARSQQGIVTQWLVNGALNPTLEVKGGSLVRVRVLNASSAGYLDLRAPELNHIASDQGLLPALRTPDRLVLGPGDRAELLFRVGEDDIALQTGPWSLNGGATVLDAAPPWSKVRTLATLAVSEPATAPAMPSFPWQDLPPTPDPGYRDLVYTFSGSPYTGTWVINGERFPNVTIHTIPAGQPRIIEVRNLSPTEHPFHLHGMVFEVLSVNGQAPAYRQVEDTINVGIRQRVRLRVVANHPGDWMAHCHILTHADDGMMTVLRVQ